MHANIATPGVTAYQHTGNGRDHLRMVESPNAHIIFPSWCSSEYSLSCVTQHVNYTQVQNFDRSLLVTLDYSRQLFISKITNILSDIFINKL